MSTPKTDKDTKGKSIEKVFSKVSPTAKCYKCQGYGHIVANCSNPVKTTFVNGVPVAESESNSHEFIYQGKEEDSDVDEEITGDGVGLNCNRPTSSTHLSVVKCVSSQSTEKKRLENCNLLYVQQDWR